MAQARRKSTVNPAIDPFAPRAGRSLVWDSLKVNVRKTKDKHIDILKCLSGTAKPGDLTCIMGQSGSGKTSLLHTLAGRVSASRQYLVEGDIYLDGKKVDPSAPSLQNQIAYTEQSDSLLATATPREAIRFAARLRLHRSLTDNEIDELTQSIIDELRLSSVADLMIGGTYARGLSGGELRRVSLGVQLVVSPSILFLDEITSGLDSHNAAVVMDICHNVASAGTTILMVLHQPSSNIFAMIDKLILLDHGRCMYNGKASLASSYFARKGHPMPENYNPADWILQVSLEVKMADLEKSGFFSNDFQDLSNHDSGELRVPAAGDTSALVALDNVEKDVQQMKSGEGATLGTQTAEQLQRDLRTLTRDSSGMLNRLIFFGASSTLTAISFTNVGSGSLQDPVKFSSHVGAIFFLLLGTTIVMQLVLFDFIEVRDLFIRELRANQYSIFSFGMTKVSIEIVLTMLEALLVAVLVFWSLDLQGQFWYFLLVLYTLTMVNSSMSFLLGALPKDSRNAKEFIALLILPQLLFSGFFVDPESLPVWISWLLYVMPTTYAFRLLLADEFAECLDFTVIERQTLNCIQSLSNAADTLGSDWSIEELTSFYSENTTIQVAQVGFFEGQEDTVEYITFIDVKLTPTTIFPNKCAVGETSMVLKSMGPEMCEITTASVEQAEVNPELVREKYADTRLINVLQGSKVQFQPSVDLQSISITGMNTYFAQGVFDEVIDKQLDPIKTASHICETLEEFCPASWEKDGFADQADCIASMASLSATSPNDRRERVLDGNSTGCRLVHAALARKRDTHCPHISFFPEEDENGKFKCQESNNFRVDDLFDERDLMHFSLTAAAYGLNSSSQTRSATTDPTFGSLSERDTCLETPFQEGASKIATLPANLFCAQYLESQDATGAEDTTYWIALVCMFVGIRSLGLFALRTRARGQFLPQSWAK